MNHTPTSHAAQAGIDLDSEHFTAADLDDLEAIAKRAPITWYGTYQIVDGISDEKAVDLIEACSPDTVRTLVSMARSALARNAACAATSAADDNKYDLQHARLASIAASPAPETAQADPKVTHKTPIGPQSSHAQQDAAPYAKPWKDHEVRILVNDLRAIAQSYHATQQLRGQISERVGRFLDTVNLAPSAATTDPVTKGWLAALSQAMHKAETKWDKEKLTEILHYFATPSAATGKAAADNAGGQADLDAALRQEVITMYQLLDDGEWAEHIARTPHGQCLETAITKLVGKANATSAADAKDAALTWDEFQRFSDDYDEIRTEEGVYTLTGHDKFVISNFAVDMFESVESDRRAAIAASQKGGA